MKHEGSMRPSQFEVSVSGFPWGSRTVRLKRGSVALSRWPESIAAENVNPTAQQWDAFRAVLDEIGVWKWATDYDHPYALDGEQWKFKIRYADRSIDCHGSNSYPGADGQPNGEPRRTAEFEAVLHAIGELVGGQPFE